MLSRDGVPTEAVETIRGWMSGLNRLVASYKPHCLPLFNEKEMDLLFEPKLSGADMGLIKNFLGNRFMFSRDEIKGGYTGFPSPDELHLNTTFQQIDYGKKIALDFMGTMNDPRSKDMIWGAVQDAIIQDDTEALELSGMTKEQLIHFKQYINETKCKPMEFRDYALAQEGVKKSIGAYCSIGAEAEQLDFCNVFDDVIDFLVLSKLSGHEIEIFSTIGAPKGYNGLSQIILGNQELPIEYQNLTGGCKTAADLVGDFVVSKKKKSEPGQAVLKETANKGLHLYVDDEYGIIGDTVKTFASQEETTLPILCRVERDGVKSPGYHVPESHQGIENVLVVEHLMDRHFLKTLYR